MAKKVTHAPPVSHTQRVVMVSLYDNMQRGFVAGFQSTHKPYQCVDIKKKERKAQKKIEQTLDKR